MKYQIKKNLHPGSSGVYRVNQKGQIIIGRSRQVFIHNFNYSLTSLHIYQDGKINCWELVSFVEFKRKVREGWVKISLPKNSELSLGDGDPLGFVQVKEFYQSIQNKEDLIKEIEDTIKELNGKPSSSDICRKIFAEYKKLPTNRNKFRLKKAYENVPEHLRQYILRDMDSKDHEIRAVIYNKN